MIHVQASSVIDASIDRVWAIVGDFSALSQWLPGVQECRVEGDGLGDRVGATRRFEMGGGLFREQLLGLSIVDHRVDFAIVESPLPISGYQATVTMLPVSDGDRTFITWSSRFDSAPEHAADMAARMPRDVFQPAFDALKQRFATGA